MLVSQQFSVVYVVSGLIAEAIFVLLLVCNVGRKYRKAGYFQGGNFSWIDTIQNFKEVNFRFFSSFMHL